MWTTYFEVREVAEESAARPGGSATTREPAKIVHVCVLIQRAE